MRRLLAFFLTLWLTSSSAKSADSFVVKYVSMEHVYLNGGEADGLNIGTRLNVMGSTGVKVELEVVFAAEHSASCKVIGRIDLVQLGDRVELQTPVERDTAQPAEAAPIQMATPIDTAGVRTTTTRPKRTPSPLSGYLSFVVYHSNDETVSDLDFTQATSRLSLKARRLFGQELTLSIRGRGRFDQRVRTYALGVDDKDWSNRLWELSLSYDDPSSPVAASLGRILPRRVGTIGYFDGALVETRLAPVMRFGLFGGTSPDWMYDDQRLTLMRAGGYLAFLTGAPSTYTLEQTVGFVGEYHAGEISREYLVMQGRFSRGNSWGVGHTAEFDVNRRWRKLRAGKSLELSNLYLNGWFRPSDRIRLSVSYDNRTNYWTLDSRSTVDSLFDDHLRQGTRGQVDVSLPGQLYSSASVGYRNREGDPSPTWSYSGSIRKGNLLLQGLSLSVQYAGFDGPTTRGSNYAVRANRTFGGRYFVGSGVGNYTYKTDGLANKRTNNWIELSGQADLGRHYWLGSQFLTESGDDLKGYRMQFELGYRF